MANYSFGINPLPEIENGHTFTGDNFLQRQPHTKIFEGKTGLRFINCNLTNCDIPADSECIGCGPKHTSFCTNLNPYLIEIGFAPCAENCAHVTNTDSVTVDGVLVDTIYTYQNLVVA